MFGFWVFLMSDAILFGLLFATYVTMLHPTAGGPGPRNLRHPERLHRNPRAADEQLHFRHGLASLKIRATAAVRLLAWLGVTLILAVLFSGFELHDFLSMFHKGGVPSRSGFLSAFFALVPLHGLHVTAGCIWMVAWSARSRSTASIRT